MATNPYFRLTNNGPEQDLHEDLIIESIRIHGQDFVYIKRDNEKLDLLYGEDILNKFEETYEVEMYIATVDDFEGDGDLFSKFGVEIRDRGKLVVAQSRFVEASDQQMIRPREGDLIYFPLTGGIFEIHHVEDESIFYQLGKLHVFTLTVEQYEHSHEKFDTGYEMIDSIANDKFTYSYELVLDTGTDEFEQHELVYQGTNYGSATATAKVHSYDPDNNLLRIMDIVGEFSDGQAVVGVDSGASWLVASSNPQDMLQETMDDNKRLQDEGQDIYDFTEDDPYSNGEY